MPDTGIRLVLAFLVLGVWLSSPPAHSVGLQTDKGLADLPKHKSWPRYKLILNKDDVLCKSITGLYNKLYVDELDKMKSGKLYPGKEDTQTDFEVTDTAKFSAIGLKVPPLIAGDQDYAIRQADVYNDGKQHAVLVGDSRTGTNINTQIAVLKDGWTNTSLKEFLSSYEVWQDMIDVALSLDRKAQPVGVKIKKFSAIGQGHPFTSDPFTTRMFSYDSVVLFISNAYSFVSFEGFGTSLVVYKITHNHVDGLCSLKLLTGEDVDKSALER